MTERFLHEPHLSQKDVRTAEGIARIRPDSGKSVF